MPTTEDLEVTVVSRNSETLGGLHAYLCAAGVSARCTSDIHACVEVASVNVIAFVFFPDDFPIESVRVALADVAERRPRALPVLVTSRAKALEGMHLGKHALVVPRPVWGWAILDAIRAHLDRQRAAGRRHGGHT